MQPLHRSIFTKQRSARRRAAQKRLSRAMLRRVGKPGRRPGPHSFALSRDGRRESLLRRNQQQLFPHLYAQIRAAALL